MTCLSVFTGCYGPDAGDLPGNETDAPDVDTDGAHEDEDEDEDEDGDPGGDADGGTDGDDPDGRPDGRPDGPGRRLR